MVRELPVKDKGEKERENDELSSWQAVPGRVNLLIRFHGCGFKPIDSTCITYNRLSFDGDNVNFGLPVHQKSRQQNES